MKMSTKLMKSRVLFAAIIFALFSFESIAQHVRIVGYKHNCVGTPATLSVNIHNLNPPYKYRWSNGETTATITISSDILLNVKVRGWNNQGNHVQVISADKMFTFITPTITVNGSTNLCPGGSVELKAHSGGAATTWLWSNGETTKEITVTQSGNYSVVMTKPSGCSATSIEQAVTVYDNSYKPVITPDGPTTFCNPGSVNLSGDAGFSSYSWSTGENTEIINVALDGSQAGAVLDTQSVTLAVGVDNNTCSFTSDVLVLRSIRETELIEAYCPSLDLALSDSIKNGLILSYNGVDPDYEFEFTETTNLSNVFTHIAVQSRWLRLSDVPQLEVGKTYDVHSRGVISGIPYCYGKACQIGITSLVAPSGGNTRVIIDEDGERIVLRDGINFTVFPNPSNSNFTANIFTADENPVNVKVLDMSGRTVASYQVNASQSQFQFGNELKAGIYFVEFSQGGAFKQTTRLVKTN